MSPRERLLVVEDDPAVGRFLKSCLTSEGYQSDLADDGFAADRMLESRSYDLVLTDLKLPGLDGMSLLSRHADSNKGTPFLIMTGFGTIHNAVEAMKLGAVDFLTKPIQPRALLDSIQRALARSDGIKKKSTSSKKCPILIGESLAFQDLIEQLDLVAPMPTTVLLTGDTGTGKEVAARYLHHKSKRGRGPFVSLHCGAIPDTLLEDELFGHVKGAFTGAVAHRPGCFETANGGTLFLDEIGTMSVTLQAKLLRVLQDLHVRRLGGTRDQSVDVRVIAATNCNLEEKVEKGEFRADLYYRLSVFPIQLPRLRERGEDRVRLARHFAKTIGEKLGTGPKRLSLDAETKISNYSWPGNVRHLENTLERAVVVSRNRNIIEATDLKLDAPTFATVDHSLEVSIPRDGIKFDSVVTQLERQLILKSLEIAGGNKKQAAELLHMKRTTLIEKLKRLNPTAQAC